MNTDFFEQMLAEAEIPEGESAIDPEILQNPNIKPVAVAMPIATPSFKQPIQEAIANNIDDFPKKKRFIMKEVVIDKFNTKRFRVLLTPSVCDICAFDVATKQGGWENIAETEKEKVRKAVIEHKRVVHPLNQNLIVNEDEIAKVWLGQR